VVEQEYERARRQARGELDALIESEKRLGVEITELVVEGDPLEAVMGIVRDEQIDLIVMLAPDRKHVEHYQFRYNLGEIVRKMPCSVLVVRAAPDAAA
jgi:nucleotide-binding universal stress UspA family protein